MKKIITSAAVAAALTTGAFAAANATAFLSTDTNSSAQSPITYSATYVEAAGGAVVDGSNEFHTLNIDLNTTAEINNKYLVTVTLSEGAKFNGTAQNWTLMTDVNGTDTIKATGAQLTENVLKMVANDASIPAESTYRLQYKGDDANLSIASTATKDITLTFGTRDNENAIEIDGATSDAITIFKVANTEVAAKIECPTVAINQDDKSRFTPATSVTATTAVCEVNIEGIEASDIDFNYADVNLTYSFAGGNFADGNFTIDGKTYSDTVPYVVADNLGEDANRTLTYTLSGDNTLVGTDFDIIVGAQFNADNNRKVTLSDDETKDMTWTLSTYLVSVMNMRYKAGTLKETYITVFNNGTVDSPIIVTAQNPNGTKVENLEMGTVKAGNSFVVSAGAIMAKDATIINGFTAEVSLDEVPNKSGDAIAVQRSDFGQVSMRIVDNSGDATKKGQ